MQAFEQGVSMLVVKMEDSMNMHGRLFMRSARARMLRYRKEPARE